jgi:membrane protein DedA with SNARE-associated domain
MLSWLDEFLIPLITSMYEAVGYLGVAIAMAVDASSFPVPSEFILPFAGFLVADPTAVEPLTGGRWLLIPTIAAATLGGLVGTWGAYAIGAYGGRPLLNRFGRIVRIDPADLDRADAFFARHGGKIVFWSRFIPLLRTAISFPAGIARMPLGRFLLYSAVGSLIWNSALIGGGAALGQNWEQVKEWLKPLDTLLLIVGVPALLLLGAWRLGLLARLRGARRDRRG